MVVIYCRWMFLFFFFGRLETIIFGLRLRLSFHFFDHVAVVVETLLADGFYELLTLFFFSLQLSLLILVLLTVL